MGKPSGTPHSSPVTYTINISTIYLHRPPLSPARCREMSTRDKKPPNPDLAKHMEKQQGLFMEDMARNLSSYLHRYTFAMTY